MKSMSGRNRNEGHVGQVCRVGESANHVSTSQDDFQLGLMFTGAGVRGDSCNYHELVFSFSRLHHEKKILPKNRGSQNRILPEGKPLANRPAVPNLIKYNKPKQTWPSILSSSFEGRYQQ